MDNFDKLISQKIDQNHISNADQAWNDFNDFRNSKVKSSKSGFFQKRGLKNILILLFVSLMSGGIGYYIASVNLLQSKMNVSSNQLVKDVHSKDFSKSPFSKSKVLLSHNLKQPSLLKVNSLNKTNLDNSKSEKSKRNPIDISFVSPIVQCDSAGVNQRPSQNISIYNSTNENLLTDSQLEDVTKGGDFSKNQPQISEIVFSQVLNKQSETTTTRESRMPIVSSGTPSNIVKKGRKKVFKSYLSTFKRYTDISLLNLDNTADIASAFHAQFLQNPANTGCENRYAITAGMSALFLKSDNHQFDLYENSEFVSNSFTLANNKVGVGIALNHLSSSTADIMNFYLSTAYNFVLAKNQHFRFGIGYNSSTIELINSDVRSKDNSLSSFNLGARYEYKTLFAQLYANNLFPITELRNEVYPIPTTWKFSTGGRLLLSKMWAFHPEVSVGKSYSELEVGSKVGFSYRNKWLFGLQTDDYKSLGVHAGASFGKRLSVLFKTDVFRNNISDNRISERGAVLVKLELGKFKR